MAVRNVLLAKQFGGYVAKLIGFGPNRESQDKNNKVSIQFTRTLCLLYHRLNSRECPFTINSHLYFSYNTS